MSPLPNTPWDGIRNATVHHRYCNQIYTSGFVGEEDCLYLSVYTPFTEFDTAPEPSLPVMVWTISSTVSPRLSGWLGPKKVPNNLSTTISE